MNETSEQWEGVGQQKDRIDNLLLALDLPDRRLSPMLEMREIRTALIRVSANLRQLFWEATGDDPWED